MMHPKNIKRRAVIIYLFMSVIAVGIISRALYTQVFESHIWNTEKYKITRNVNVNASRGNIYSDDYSLLATSIPEYEIRWDSKQVKKPLFDSGIVGLAQGLSEIFEDKTPKEYQQFLRDIKSKNSRYALIKRKVNYNQLKRLKKLPIFTEGRFDGGFRYIQKNKRQKPFKKLAGRTIGYDRKQSKSVGLEGAFNFYLKGQDGELLEQRLAGNEWMPIREIEPLSGKDIVTTIDIRFQDVAEQALENQLIYHDADYGCVILMEVETGEIKAIVNLKNKGENQFDEEYNYAIADHTEPGSTFKLASVIAGLEDGFFKTNDSISTTGGEHTFYDRTMRDSKKGGYGKISLREAFLKSSNVGISKIVFEHYKDDKSKFVDRLYSMGLNDPLNISISGESAPNIIHPKGNSNWNGTTLPWMSIGYGIEMTPLQTLSFYAAIANGGKRMQPLFVKAIVNDSKQEKVFAPSVLNPSICSKTTIDIVKDMMVGVVEEGTARNIRTNKYKIAGKTGTAQLLIDGAYSNQRHQASFVGYFPADQPKYACIVVIKDPKQNGSYGGDVAGPVFRAISDYVFANDYDLLNKNQLAELSTPISKDGNREDLQEVFEALNINTKIDDSFSDWVLTYSKDAHVEMKTRNIQNDLDNNIMPNIIGMGLSDVVFLLENYGIKVNFKGRGSVDFQSIEKGQRIRKGQGIIIELS
jgi:cell division protein FtsI (penicillin-binding protein 3)